MKIRCIADNCADLESSQKRDHRSVFEEGERVVEVDIPLAAGWPTDDLKQNFLYVETMPEETVAIKEEFCNKLSQVVCRHALQRVHIKSQTMVCGSATELDRNANSCSRHIYSAYVAARGILVRW
jgi:hypothetical protein